MTQIEGKYQHDEVEVERERKNHIRLSVSSKADGMTAVYLTDDQTRELIRALESTLPTGVPESEGSK